MFKLQFHDIVHKPVDNYNNLKMNCIYTTIFPIKFKFNQFNNKLYKYNDDKNDIKYLHYDDPMHSQK